MTNSELEHQATRRRLEALSRDWQRLRDIEREWRNFSYWTFMSAGVLAIVMCVSLIAGWL